MNITLTQSEILLIVKKHLESKNMTVDIENIQLAPAGSEVVAKALDVEFKQPEYTTIDGNRIFWSGNENKMPLGVKTPYIEKKSIQPKALWNTTSESKLSQESPEEKTEGSIKVNGGMFSVTPSATEQIADTLSSAYEFFKPHATDAEKAVKAFIQLSDLVKSKPKQ